MKRKLLLSVLGLVAVSVGGFYYYTTTPTYSVLQIRNAVQDHDVALFEKHVDVDTLFNRLIDDVMAQALSQAANEDNSGWSTLGSALGAGIVQMMKPTLVSGLKSSTLRYVETGELVKGGQRVAASAAPAVASDAAKKASLDGMASSFGLEQLKLQDYGVEKQGKVAIVTIPYRNEQLDLPLEMKFTLRDQGGYWQLVQFNNAAEIMSAIEQEQQRRLTEANNKITAAPQKPVSVNDELLWSVQVASLSSKETAEKLEMRLKEAGYEAYTTTADSMNRIFCGPYKGREHADIARDQLQRQQRLNGFVVRYEDPKVGASLLLKP